MTGVTTVVMDDSSVGRAGARSRVQGEGAQVRAAMRRRLVVERLKCLSSDHLLKLRVNYVNYHRVAPVTHLQDRVSKLDYSTARRGVGPKQGVVGKMLPKSSQNVPFGIGVILGAE